MSYDCPEKLAELYDAMMNLYRVHWNNCGAEAGLPPLDATAAVRRGRPVRGRFGR